MENVIFLERCSIGGGSLLLFDNYGKKCATMKSFIGEALRSNQFCSYISLRKSEMADMCLDFAGISNFYHAFISKIPLSINDKVERLVDIFDAIHESSKAQNCRSMMTIIDFGTRFGEEEIESIIPCLEDIRRTVPMSIQSVFDLHGMNQGLLGRLLRYHDTVTLFADDAIITSLHTSDGTGKAPLGIVSKEALDQCVRKSSEILTLSILLKGPVCGYDIIRTLAQSFGVVLSQGTVYPYLYHLKNKGYVEYKLRPDNKTKEYVLKEAGKQFAHHKIHEHALAQNRIMEAIDLDNLQPWEHPGMGTIMTYPTI